MTWSLSYLNYFTYPNVFEIHPCCYIYRWFVALSCLVVLYSIHLKALCGSSLKIDLACRKTVGYFWIGEKIMGEGKKILNAERIIDDYCARRVFK